MDKNTGFGSPLVVTTRQIKEKKRFGCADEWKYPDEIDDSLGIGYSPKYLRQLSPEKFARKINEILKEFPRRFLVPSRDD